MPHRAVGAILSQLQIPLWTLLGPWSEGLGFMNPLVVCISICLCVCLYKCLYVCLYVSLWVLVCLWLAMNVYMYFSVCLHVFACVFACVCVSENVFVCVCLCPCTVGGASLGLTLRGRGLPVHVYTPVACVWKVVVESCKDAGVLGPQRRRIQSGARDEAWWLRAFV